MASADKVGRVLEAAAAQFMRYGYARTTMGDIAVAAGMSRPSLYLLYPGKAEVFEAAVRHLSQTRYAEIREALRADGDWRGKLQMVCEQVLLVIYELQRDNPDARDMDDLAFPVV
ncbi:MAG TPA: helix-turn-helix domain-containing protein, partial [Novosphingobium sp.]